MHKRMCEQQWSTRLDEEWNLFSPSLYNLSPIFVGRCSFHRIPDTAEAEAEEAETETELKVEIIIATKKVESEDKSNGAPAMLFVIDSARTLLMNHVDIEQIDLPSLSAKDPTPSAFISWSTIQVS